MKKYILVALTLGLTSTSYGASYGSDRGCDVRTAAMLASSQFNTHEEAFQHQMQSGFSLVSEENRGALAGWVNPIFQANWPITKGRLVVTALDGWFQKYGFYASPLAPEEQERKGRLQFILMHGGDHILDLYNAIYPNWLSPKNPRIVDALYSYINAQQGLKSHMRVLTALAHLKAHPEILDSGYDHGLSPWEWPAVPTPTPLSTAVSAPSVARTASSAAATAPTSESYSWDKGGAAAGGDYYGGAAVGAPLGAALSEEEELAQVLELSAREAAATAYGHGGAATSAAPAPTAPAAEMPADDEFARVLELSKADDAIAAAQAKLDADLEKGNDANFSWHTLQEAMEQRKRLARS